MSQQSSPQKTKQRFQQALRRAEQQKDQLAVAVAHSGLAQTHLQLDTPDLARLHADQAENIAREIRSADRNGLGDQTAPIFKRIATVHEKLGSLDKAVSAYRRALNIYSETKQSDKTAETFCDIGELLLTHADYEQALTAILQACQIAHARNNHTQLARCYRLLATLYFEQEGFEQAHVYAQKSMQSAQKSGQHGLIADSYNIAAVLQKYLGKTESARQMHQTALQLRQQIGDKQGVADSYHNIGLLDEEVGAYQAAIEKYTSALKVRKEVDDQAGQLRSHAALGSVYFSTETFEKAKSHLGEALTIARERGERRIESDLLRELATVHANCGEYAQAFELQKQHTAKQAALFNSNRDERLAAIHAHINAGREQRILEVARLRARELETRIQKLEAERSLETERIGGVATRLLQSQKKIVELERVKSEVIRLLSHEFRTPLTVIGNAIYILERFGKRLSAEKQEDNFERIKEAIESLKSLLDDVCWIDTATSAELTIDPKPITIRTLISQATARLSVIDRDRLHLTLPEEDSSIVVDSGLVQQVVYHLVSNGLKFSEPDLLEDKTPQPVEIDVLNEQNQLQIIVRDYGIGISPSAMQHVTELFYRGDNVSEQHGLGMGLAIVQKITVSLKGELKIQPKQPGTQVTVVLPAIVSADAAPPDDAFLAAARKRALSEAS